MRCVSLLTSPTLTYKCTHISMTALETHPLHLTAPGTSPCNSGLLSFISPDSNVSIDPSKPVSFEPSWLHISPYSPASFCQEVESPCRSVLSPTVQSVAICGLTGKLPFWQLSGGAMCQWQLPTGQAKKRDIENRNQTQWKEPNIYFSYRAV